MITKLHQSALAQGNKWSIRQLCQLLEVNRAWYYQRLKEVTVKKEATAQLRSEVEKIVLEFPGYGYRRVAVALQKKGIKISWGRVLKLLRNWGCCAEECVKRKCRLPRAIRKRNMPPTCYKKLRKLGR